MTTSRTTRVAARVMRTSYWTVEWEGMGQFGTIRVEFTSFTNIVMGEAQVITQ